MLNNLKKGDVVRVQTHGEVITRRVWDVEGERVFLCTEEAYQKSSREGKQPLVGFTTRNEIQAVS